MYSQLLYFIIALLLFTIQQPGPRALLTAPQTFLLAAVAFLLFVAACHFTLRRLKQAVGEGLPQSIFTRRYHRAQTHLSILALGALAIDVYVLNVKFYLGKLPGFEQSISFPGLVGLGLYLLHLGVIWTWSYPLYKRIYQSEITLPAFIRGHLAFSSAILIPWLLLSLISDLMQLFTLPAFLNTDQGQFLSLAFLLLIFVLFAPWLVVRLWGCKSLPPTNIRSALEGFCLEKGFRVGDFLMWPLFGGDTLTAGIMGVLPRFRYILVTKGLMTFLDIEELKAVVAHEMGHIRKYHLFFYLLFFLSYSVLAYSLNDFILLFLLKHDTILQWALTPSTLDLTLFSLVYSLPIVVLLVVYFRYIFGFFLRNSERQADLYALTMIGHPFTLVSSLEKIGIYSGHIRDLPSWHHFSIRQRVEFLLDSYRNPALIRRHHVKLYAAALVFLTVVAGLSSAGFNLKGTKLAQQWRTELQLHIFEREIRQEPANPAFYSAYGGLLLELNRFKEADATLLKALELAPQDPNALNNLAWLYATSPPPYFHPEQALELATRAAAIEASPPILDTLAEASFVNGRYQDALDAIERALAQSPANRQYFLGQKEKFEKALRKGR